MKNSLLRGTFKWGATYACINFAMALLLPMPPTLDAQVIIFLSPVIGFVGGAALHTLNFLASEAVRFIEYQLTKVEGLTWSNHIAVRRVRYMTTCGLWGACFFLLFLILMTFTQPIEDDPVFFILVPTFLAVFGFVLGLITYFFFWGMFPILGYILTRGEYFRVPVIRGFRALMQLYQKWKHHDYRS